MTERPDKHMYEKGEVINWFEIIRKIRNGRKTIFITIAVFVLLGIIYIIFAPKEYKSESVVIVETSSAGGTFSGLVQQFSGLTGMNLDKNQQESLIPELYPDVVLSTSFLLELSNQKIIESDYDSSITVGEYIDRYTSNNILIEYTFNLPSKIKKLLINNDSEKNKQISVLDTNFTLLDLTSKQFDIVEKLSDRISTSDEFKKNNKFGISVEMQDPDVAAQINYLIVKKLEEYIIDYRTKKAKSDLLFISARYDEAKENYIDAQQELASYRDRNKNVILQSVISEEDRLEAEYNLAFDVYNTLAQQLEEAKIKVQENTPVLIVIDPANIPLEKDKPKTILIIMAVLFLGIFVGVGIVFGKPVYRKIINEL